MRACMCSLFHLALGNEDGGVQLVYKSTCCLAWRVIFDKRKDRGVVCVVSIFNAGGSVLRVYVCVYARTHTHCTDGVLGGPEESRWTKSRHTYIRTCVQSKHVYVMEILDQLLFCLTFFFFGRKAKNVNANHR